MIKRIFLSAGHGPGQNAGVVEGYREGTRMYEYSLFLKPELEALGFSVVLARTSLNQNPGLSERARLSKAFGADLHYMLHSDAAGPSARGVTVLRSIKRPGDQSHAQAITDALAAAMNTTARTPRYKESTAGGSDWYTEIATAVTLDIAHVFSVEHGFHTNPQDCAWLMSDANLRLLAKAEARAIYQTFNGELPADLPDTPVSGTLYRVQVGAYRERKNADAMMQKLHDKGYDTYLILASDGLYKVQIGAYAIRTNADAMAQRLKTDGFDTYLTTTGSVGVPADEPGNESHEEIIKVGDTVRVATGAKTYTGGNLANYVYTNVYDVIQVKGDRVVIGKGTAVTAAMRMSDLSLA